MATNTTGNLVWIDLEMTGLDVNKDVILEIATIITDGQLNELAQGPHLIIHQPDTLLDHMDQWCIDIHGASGLTQAVKDSSTTVIHAEQETLNFIKQYCGPQTGLLAGNSVWQDRVFLQKYMPSITNYLFYRLVDVTTIKVLVDHWYPHNPGFKKNDAHRALEDIKESIAELRFYQNQFFV